MKILVTSDSPDTFNRAVRFLEFLPRPAEATLMLTVKDQVDAQDARDRLISHAEAISEGNQTPIETKIAIGSTLDEVIREADEGDYDLVVLGVHQQRRLSNIRPKSLAKDLAKRLRTPLMVVSPAWDKLEKMLIWTSGEKPDEVIIRRAGQLAAALEVEVTILHVMSQIPLTADADTRDLERDADSLMENQTHEGRHFEKAKSILREVGVPTEKFEVKVRRGLTLDEIIEESEQGDFDLIVASGTQVEESDTWAELRELIQQDTAIEILMNADRPVLIMRAEDISEDFGQRRPNPNS